MVRSILAGCIGGALMSLWLALCRALGMDVAWERMLGDAVTGTDAAWAGVVGYFAHLALAAALASADAWLLKGVTRGERMWLAVLLGMAQALALGTVVGALVDGPGAFLSRRHVLSLGALFTLGHVLLAVSAAWLTEGTARMRMLRVRAAVRRLRNREGVAPRLSALQRGVVRRTRRGTRRVPPVWVFPPHA